MQCMPIIPAVLCAGVRNAHIVPYDAERSLCASSTPLSLPIALQGSNERPHGPGEEIANSVIHGMAPRAAIVAVPFLLAPTRPRYGMRSSTQARFVIPSTRSVTPGDVPFQARRGHPL
jgi:hypothetical protein